LQLLEYNVKNVVIHMLNIRYILMEFIPRLKKMTKSRMLLRD